MEDHFKEGIDTVAEIKAVKPFFAGQGYQLRHPLRMVTATTLFDGHDVTINLLRRLLLSAGVEVIHLGHNRSVEEIVRCAVQEDVQAVVITSCQGGHVEFFQYMYNLLQHKAPHISIFGGGSTILPAERDALHRYGITHIYLPDEGRELGLQGMIEHLISRCKIHPILIPQHIQAITEKGDNQLLASLISLAENHPAAFESLESRLAFFSAGKTVPVLGITGTGGAGKSTLIDELLRQFLTQFEDKHAAVICVDPTRKKTGGALLSDRIRMNGARHPHVHIRSVAVRSSAREVMEAVKRMVSVYKAAGFDLIIIETPGAGQSDMAIADCSDISLYVMTSEFGAPSQLEKLNMLDWADLVAFNKFSKYHSLDALQQVRRQYRRNHGFTSKADKDLPVIATNAAIFNDAGMKQLYQVLLEKINSRTGCCWKAAPWLPDTPEKGQEIIPRSRAGYLDEIVETLHGYNRLVDEQSQLARKLFQLHGTKVLLHQQPDPANDFALLRLEAMEKDLQGQLAPAVKQIIQNWDDHLQPYREGVIKLNVNGKEQHEPLYVETLSHVKMPKVCVPKWEDWGERVRWSMQENLPGFFPFTAGVFPFRREEEATRLTAGEGSAARSNRRFHYLTKGMKAKRLSTAFDSVTLYGADPDHRPDIYGKIGGTGVSVSHLDDAKILYAGFDLADASTSVNLTINGPSAIILAFFLHAAIDQQCEIYIRQNGLTEKVRQQLSAKFDGTPGPVYTGIAAPQQEQLGLLLLGATGEELLAREVYEQIKSDTLKRLRGTVQCDILKEDQAQNTCIFSTSFSLKVMGDIQEYFIAQQIRHFYAVSVSGYHIAEAGANPITQIAFTLANAFTYIEYYLSRGMKIDQFVPSFSFFFSSGLDPEYMVLGRVCRRIWAKVLKHKYGAGERSQKLKYHIQTSGRSLHPQEIDFNDIRTTLQALNAVYDNCNSLHTNAHDEALSLPTEKSVRKALAIQKIIDQEMGFARNQNPLQGSFIIEELTGIVEEAVIRELHQVARRGGVLPAMESAYQRSRIQEESMYYETLKHSGALPIIGVNRFQDENASSTDSSAGVVRIGREECNAIIEANRAVRARNKQEAEAALAGLQRSIQQNKNVFESLMETSKWCTLGQLSAALFKAGGEYRRNL